MTARKRPLEGWAAYARNKEGVTLWWNGTGWNSEILDSAVWPSAGEASSKVPSKGPNAPGVHMVTKVARARAGSPWTEVAYPDES
jgi:hypothetical protein